ncbi:GNAT family N-acetyltransferase [Pseudomonas putida]|uniref:GNAT family N-acetyltransferase n=1 Tax=Pseudomonas putida TaxID=303 RepID=UPI003355087C
MSTEIVITKAKNDHAKSVARLLSLANEQALTASLRKPDAKAAQAEFEKSFTKSYAYINHGNIYVAQSRGRIAACIHFFRGGDKQGHWPTHLPNHLREPNNDELFIDSLAIDVDLRGNGIAKLLISRVITDAEELGLKKVSLLVDASKPHLIGLYSRLGFRMTEAFSHEHGDFQKMTYFIPTGKQGLSLIERALHKLIARE